MSLPGFNYAETILDEICLEGLDGITIESLWLRISVRLNSKVNQKLKEKFWKIILQLHGIKFYLLPQPRPTIQVFDRFAEVDEIGLYVQLPQHETDVDPYPYHPVKGEYGSCEFFSSRQDISDLVKKTHNYEDVIKQWSDTMVIVGDVKYRWQALAPGYPFLLCEVLNNTTLFCILERIGRSRYNGELTSGKNSLNLLEKDTKTLAYFNKQLNNYGIVKKQIINFINGNSSSSLLLSLLSRFYRNLSGGIASKIGIVEDILLAQPAKMISFSDLKDKLPKDFSLQRLRGRTEFYKKFRLLKAIPHEQLCSDVVIANCAKCKNSEHLVTALSLIEDTTDVSLKNDDEACDDCDSDIKENRGSTVLGEGLLRQVYKCIRDSANTGITMKKLAELLGSDITNIRFALNYLKRYDLLYVCFEDVRRQRIARFYLKEYKNQPIKPTLEKNSKTSTMNKTVGDIHTESNDISIKLSDSINVIDNKTIEDINLTQSDPWVYSDSYPTLKKFKRAQLILEFLHTHHVTSQFNDIAKYIASAEAKDKGPGGLICRYSVKNILVQLEKEDKIKLFRIKVSDGTHFVNLNFACEKNISSQHPYIKATVEKQKKMLALKISESSIDKTHAAQFYSNKKKSSSVNPHPHLPKFSRLRLLHEFLFYLVYGHKKKVSDFKLELPYQDSIPVAYEDTLDKCLFVPPLNENANVPKGWMLLSEAINRLPLCLFSKLAYVNSDIPNMLNFLKDPIQCQLLISNLPTTIQYYLFYKHRHKFVITNNLEQLCLLGLIQCGEQVAKGKDEFYIYVNRNAILWDTSSSKAGYHKVEDKEYPREEFKFQSMADIENYWNRMFTICNNTSLGERYAAMGEQVESIPAEIKLAYALKKKSFEEAITNDVGYILGDGCGAGGFDSMMYSHLKRSWVHSKLISVIKIDKKRSIERMHTPAIHSKRKNLNSRDIYMLAPMIKKKKTRIIIPRKNSKVSLPKIDEIDKQVLQKLGTKRSTWNAVEDQLLLLCKIALVIIYSNKFVSNFQIIRNIIHKTVLSTSKTSFAIHRRLIFLMRNPQNVRHVEICLTDVRRNDVINNKYSNLFGRLKTKNEKKVSVDKLEKECKIHFVELVHLLYQKFIEKKVEKQLSIVLPRKITDIYDKYIVEMPSLYTSNHKASDTNLRYEIRSNVLSSFIHCTLCCSFGKESSSFSLFNTYRNFPEVMLRSTIYSLRMSGMISYKRHIENSFGKKSRKKISPNASHYKLSQNYISQLMTLFPFKLYSQVQKYLISLQTVSYTSENSDSLSGGAVAALLELIMINIVNVDLNIPQSVKDFILSNTDEDFQSSFKQSADETFVQSNEALDFLQVEKSQSHIHGPYIINCCDWNVSLLCNPQEILDINFQKISNVLEEIVSDALLSEVDTNINENMIEFHSSLSKEVFEFINEKFEVGVTHNELKEKFTFTHKASLHELSATLKQLVNEGVIRRMGNTAIRWVSTKHLLHWFVKAAPKIEESKTINTENVDIVDTKKLHDNILEDSQCKEQHKTENVSLNEEEVETICKNANYAIGEKRKLVDCPESSSSKRWCMEDLRMSNDSGSAIYISPRPWIKPDGSLNNIVFYRWAGAILNYLLSCSLVKLVELQKPFNFLQLYQIRLLVEFMEKIGCVRLVCIKTVKPNLWSKNISINTVIEAASELDEDDELYVEVIDGAILKFALYKENTSKEA